MRSARLWAHVLGVQGRAVEGVDLDGEDVVVRVRARVREASCGACGRGCPRYDRGKGPRRWRSLDFGTSMVFVEARPGRVKCPEHGVITARVPWARHGSEYTRDFEDQVAWLAVRATQAHVSELMRVAWRTVGAIVQRVSAEAAARTDQLAELERIGIDEISHRKGQKYLTIVVDHDKHRLVWAADGRNAATVDRFFDDLGEERAKSLQFVSADGASWIETVVRRRSPHATLCLDAFHVVAWATDALDEVRRVVWNEARREGMSAAARDLKDSRYALWKNPETLTASQKLKLSRIQRTNRPLYRAYLLKEQLRTLLKQPRDTGMALLKAWLGWASRSRLEPFIRLARNLRARHDQIALLLQHRLSNARTEAMNRGLRLIHRRAHGFHSAQPMIALAMLAFGGLCPPLPGRSHPLP